MFQLFYLFSMCEMILEYLLLFNDTFDELRYFHIIDCLVFFFFLFYFYLYKNWISLVIYSTDTIDVLMNI